jgi:hypothetical protein
MSVTLDLNRLKQDSESRHDDLSCAALAVIDSLNEYDKAKKAMEPIERKLKEAIETYQYVNGYDM